MIKLFYLLILMVFVLLGCTQKDAQELEVDSKEDPRKEYALLQDFLGKYEDSVQTFVARTNKQIRIDCKFGTVIHLNPNNLEKIDGEPVGDEIVVEVREVFDKRQFVTTGVQTMSNGQILVSGGAIEIIVKSDGKEVRLKKGKTYGMEFPAIAKEKMSLYYGERDSSGRMNWIPTNQPFVTPKATTDSLEEFEAVFITDRGPERDTIKSPLRGLNRRRLKTLKNSSFDRTTRYSEARLSQFGWINCDRLYVSNAPRTDVSFTIEDTSLLNFASIYLIFDGLNSVAESSFYPGCYRASSCGFGEIPIGLKVRFFAFGYMDDKIYATLTDVKPIKSGHLEVLPLKFVDESAFKSILAKI